MDVKKDTHNLREIRVLDPLPSDGNRHLDMLAYIASPISVILPEIVGTPDPNDYEEVKKAREKFESWGFDIYKVETLIFQKPPPVPMYLVFSYTNALVINDIVIVPQYYDSNPNSPCHIQQLIELDNKALQVFRDAFPGKTIIPIFVPSQVLMGLGSIHCVTLTRPALP